MKIDWKAKLSSRKFWALVSALVIAIITAFGVSDLTVQQVAIIIAALGAVAVYILAESSIDRAALGGDTELEIIPDEDDDYDE